MKYKLLIFDMDGTILNTIDDLTDSLNHLLMEYDLPTYSVEQVTSFVGNGILKLVERALPEGAEKELVDEFFSKYVSYYKEHSSIKTKPYEGITDAIKEFKKMGLLTAVVSNKRHEAVKSLCHEYFEGCFDAEIGDMDNIAKKPAPDMVDCVLNELNIDRSEALYIGDSEVDIETANNSSMDYIAVSWGFRSEELLKSLGAKLIAHDSKELIKIIKSFANTCDLL